MQTLNINSAFRLRNRLKEKVAHLSNMVAGAAYEKEAGTKEQGGALDGMTLAEAIPRATALMDLLCEFNQAIEKANEANRADLVALETIRAKIALYGQITQKCRQFTGTKSVWRREGDETIIMEPLLDQREMVKELAALKAQKSSMEEKLSRSNYGTKVDFDADRIYAAL
jgi:hypothetical protein